MRKILTLAIMFLLCLPTFSMLLPNVLANGLQAAYSTNLPVIDGSLTDPEWNDAIIHGAWLKGPTDILSHIYLKHDCTNIYIGLKVFAGQHDNDQFMFYFDEGDDGGYGSGTRDGVLTHHQEDLKIWRSSPIAGHNIMDGYYDGAWCTDVGGDFNAECVYVAPDSHWECEFAIPFVGNDGGPDDVSDLVCTIADTIGIKIQYFIEPGGNNYFYPADDQYQIETYVPLIFLPPSGVIPEVQLGTIMASAAMIIALVAYVAVPKWRSKRAYVSP